MRAVIQRVSRASVAVDGAVVAGIGRGLLILVGVAPGDTDSDAVALADKVVGLRIFPDAAGRMNRSVADVDGGVLVVSQFTLYGDARKGRRPSFTGAAAPDLAEPLVEKVREVIAGRGVAVATGRFGEMMEVELLNEGPVTLVLEVEGGRIR